MNMSERNEMLADLKRSGIDINNTSREDIVNQAVSEHGIPLGEILENLERDTVLFAVHEAMVAYNAIVFEDEDDTEDEDIVSCVVCGEAETDCVCIANVDDDDSTNQVIDEKGRIVSQIVGGELIVYAYDERGNCITETYPDGKQFCREYDGRNNMIKSIHEDGSTFLYEYNDNNKLIKFINHDGDTVTYVRDSNDVHIDTIFS